MSMTRNVPSMSRTRFAWALTTSLSAGRSAPLPTLPQRPKPFNTASPQSSRRTSMQRGEGGVDGWRTFLRGNVHRRMARMREALESSPQHEQLRFRPGAADERNADRQVAYVSHRHRQMGIPGNGRQKRRVAGIIVALD